MRFVDSHVHLSDYPGQERLVESAAAAATSLLACSVDEASSRRSIGLAMAKPTLVSAFVGVHPSEASRQTGIGWLEGLAVDASGVGEIGLDPKYSETGPGGRQMALFMEQVALAERTAKPVQVHSRKAEAACLDVLDSHRLSSVLLHWFDGESELGRAEQKGYFVSFGPALLGSRKLQRMAVKYSADLILVESDGPVGFPSLGGAEGPLLVPSVVFRLAELRGVSFRAMAETTAENAARYLPSL